MREVLPEKRRSEILKLVRSEGSASVAQLSKALNVSLSTIRRDLDYLTEMGYVARSHGGAVVDSIHRTTFEPRSDVHATAASEEKAAIGQVAADLVSPGQCVAFDSGSTVAEVARAVIRRDIPITAVTNDLRIAALFAPLNQVTLVVLGGTRRPSQFTLLGEPGVSFLSTLHVDMAFLGIHSMFEGKLTETSIEVANMKLQILRASRRSILVADSSKFRAHAFKEVASLRDFDAVITDDRVAPHNLDLLRKHEVEVHLAPTPKQNGGGEA